MSTRNCLVLDVFLFAGFVGACNPAITSFSVHEWLSVALGVPALVHVIVNWEWAVRAVDRFAEKLHAATRVNLIVDSALFLATVAVMVSGFAVSTSVVRTFCLPGGTGMSWHVLHAISAQAVFALFALHTALHWRWIARTATDLLPQTTPSLRRHPTIPGGRHEDTQAHVVSTAAHRLHRRGSPGRSRGLRDFGAGSASASTQASASIVTLTCPHTGCTASTCHAASGGGHGGPSDAGIQTR